MDEAVKEKVIECMKKIGIFVDEEEDFELGNYIEDSVSFITFIVELEQMFGIEIPDHYLSMNELNTLSDVCGMIKTIKEGVTN